MSIATSLPAGFGLESFEAFLAARREPDWLTRLRRNAWADFEQMGWPDRRDEEWIRTDIRLFKLGRFSLPSQKPTGVMPQGALAEGVELAGATASLNGFAAGTTADAALTSRGVVFGELDELLRDHEAALRPYLEKRLLDGRQDRFAALHAACWTASHVLYVPRGVRVAAPFHMSAALRDGGVDLGRTLIVLEEGAEATVLNETLSDAPNSGGLHCGATEIVLKSRANLRYVHLQDWGQGVWHFAHQQAEVARNASLQWTAAAIGGRLAKVNQRVSLVGEGADCQVNGVLFTEGKQHLSYHTLQHHKAAHCRSDFLYKSALQDQSRTVWRGLIKVDPGAQKTDGYQRNDNLLLSSSARADSIPGLEIEADDVRCTHGSTTSKVDEELIFYCQCRGYTRREATRLIVSGFFQQIFDRITIESVRDALGHAIGRRVREYS
ncbi:MAG: Fe-S cluster assembly protein SufD [Planctomycetota bacterium]